MRDLLPAEVAVAVAAPADWAGDLLPAELTALGERAVPGRRRDF
ncbi:4-phosphopantetheinyl transferase, partial [Micromonospora aurantiaca]|nr:4-phosphopantetheinyl transferase [Micromonospora aurantiaca]